MPSLHQSVLIETLIKRIIKFKNVGGLKSNIDSKGKISEFLLISCVDKRIDPLQVINVPLGRMYVVRNPGNLIPNQSHHSYQEITNESGAVELAVKKSGIQDIIVCGHSDCKAMTYLFQNEGKAPDSGPLSNWIFKFTSDTWKKYQMFVESPSSPLKFQLRSPDKPLSNAFIDSKFSKVDCLSQINTLQQVENIVNFPFLREELSNSKLHINAMWHKLAEGDDKVESDEVYLFDRLEERFFQVTEQTYNKLIHDFEE